MRDTAEPRRRRCMSRPAPQRESAPEALLECDNGRLILVSCADPSRLDLVLRSVERRLRPNPRISFIEPISTQRLPAGGGVVLSRNAFASLDRAGALPVVWSSAGHLHGHTVNLLARLATGNTVVTGTSFDIEHQLRALWPDFRLIRIATGTDKLRAGLSPRACLSRVAGDLTGPAGLRRMLTDSSACRVCDDSDLATVVRRLSNAIEGLLPPSLGQSQTRRPARATSRRADKPQAVFVPAA